MYTMVRVRLFSETCYSLLTEEEYEELRLSRGSDISETYRFRDVDWGTSPPTGINYAGDRIEVI
jgi:hypothetical protein